MHTTAQYGAVLKGSALEWPFNLDLHRSNYKHVILKHIPKYKLLHVLIFFL